ncbi:MAG: hypothetical protein AB1758_31105 [Candidatus Eremiobacterota bacterium]
MSDEFLNFMARMAEENEVRAAETALERQDRRWDKLVEVDSFLEEQLASPAEPSQEVSQMSTRHFADFASALQ